MTVPEIINDVVAWVPDEDQRALVAMDLRAQIDRGVTPEELVARYGSPRAVAEAYTASVPLESGGFLRRAVAALIDIPSVIASGFLMFYFAWKVFGTTDQSFVTAIMLGNPVAVALCFATLVLMSPLYYAIADSTTGQTVGKAFLGLRVVRESGARVSIGQAFVRQIPLLCSFYVFDALFALFTEKNQRLFELISHTRVVRVRPETE